jgi:hypothetical protein
MNYVCDSTTVTRRMGLRVPSDSNSVDKATRRPQKRVALARQPVVCNEISHIQANMAQNSYSFHLYVWYNQTEG